MSPYCTRRLLGMPCTTSSFTDTQMCPDSLVSKERALAPTFVINSAAVSFNSAVVRPGWTSRATAAKVSAAALQRSASAQSHLAS